MSDLLDIAQELEQYRRDRAIARIRAHAGQPPSGPRYCDDCEELLTPSKLRSCDCGRR